MSITPENPERELLSGRESPSLSAADHPERALMQQARAGVQRLPAWMFDAEQGREQLAAALVFEARLAGLTRIDDVVPGVSGTGVFALQGRVGDLEQRSVYVDLTYAAAQSVEDSTRRLRQEEEAARRREAERAATAEPGGPAGPFQRLRTLLP